MKNVPDKELKWDLDSILNGAQSERIVISRGGKPCAVLVGIEDYDAEDLGLATSEKFWHMIRERRASGKSFPLAGVEMWPPTSVSQISMKKFKITQIL